MKAGLRKAVTAAVSTTAPRWAAASRRARRAAFVAKVKAVAAATPADIELELAPDIDIAPGVQLSVTPHSRNRIAVGSQSRIERGVAIRLKGGSLEIGPRVEIRRDTVLVVGGRLVVEGDTPISWNCAIHCESEVVLRRQVGLAEQVTVADSSHYFTTPDEHFWHNQRATPVEVGENTWLCPKVTVTRGAKIGSHCIVASNSVVVGNVPDGSLASGVPAAVRPLPLPWQDDAAGP